jgi:hypothetical protein
LYFIHTTGATNAAGTFYSVLSRIRVSQSCQKYFVINVRRKSVFYIYFTELGAATDKISQQPENCDNRNDPDLVQEFLKKWWVESDIKAPNLSLSLRLKVSGCDYNSIYNNT